MNNVRLGSWRNGIAALLWIGALLLAACSPTIDYEDVEGVGFADDQLFRFVDFPAATESEAFDALERLIRMHFAGARLFVDRAAFTIETEPRPFSTSAQRVTLFGQVSLRPSGARVELFAQREALRDDLARKPETPWKYIGPDAQLENLLFQELWDALIVAKRVDGAGEQPTPERSPVPAEGPPSR